LRFDDYVWCSTMSGARLCLVLGEFRMLGARAIDYKKLDSTARV